MDYLLRFLIGGVAVSVFAAVAVYLLATGSPLVCLAAAGLVWLAVAIAVFFARRKFRRTSRSP